jgi:hypothetical protein
MPASPVSLAGIPHKPLLPEIEKVLFSREVLRDLADKLRQFEHEKHRQLRSRERAVIAFAKLRKCTFGTCAAARLQRPRVRFKSSSSYGRTFPLIVTPALPLAAQLSSES